MRARIVAAAVSCAPIMLLGACGSATVAELPAPAAPDRSPAASAPPPAAAVLTRGAGVELLAATTDGQLVHGRRGAAELELGSSRSGSRRALALDGPVAAISGDRRGGVLIALQDGRLARATARQLRATPAVATTSSEVVDAPAAVADAGGGAVVVSRATSRLQAWPSGGEPITTPLEPLSVASLRSGRLAVTVGGRERAVQLVALTGGGARPIEQVSAGVGPTNVACAQDGPCFVVDTAGDALLVARVAADGSGLRISRRVFLAGAPYAIAIDQSRRRLWVTLTGRNEVVELGAHGRPHVLRRLPAPRQPDSVAVDPRDGAVIVGGRAAGELWRYAPGS